MINKVVSIKLADTHTMCEVIVRCIMNMKNEHDCVTKLDELIKSISRME